MRAAALLLTLCLAGYVSTDFAWKVGLSYTYYARGRTFTGLSQHTQYSGLQLEYQVVLTVVGPNTLNLKPQNFKAIEVNNEIDGGWRDGILQNESPAQINGQLKEYLEQPIEMTMRQGVVESIKVNKNLPTWVVNMKKAQVSHFILDTTGANVVISGNLNRKSNSVRPDEANQDSGYFYETMEETIHGECETYYTVSQNGPFDAPFQFQKQAQPVDRAGFNSDENDDKSKQQTSSSSEEDDNNDATNHRSYENFQQYQTYKKLAQNMDSASAEDSHETINGELPWPKAFKKFCEQGDQIYEIMKSVNFTTCKNKPVLAYSTSTGIFSRQGDNSIGSLWQRTVNTRYLACGRDRKQYTILNVIQDEQTNSGHSLEQRILAASVVNMTLSQINKAGPVTQVQNPRQIDDLTYTFDPKEQQQQRKGQLQHGFFDNLEDNDSSSEEHQQHRRTTTTHRPHHYDNFVESTESQSQQDSDEDENSSTYYQNQFNKHHAEKSRKPRAVSSQESSEEDEEQDNDPDNRRFQPKPSLSNPPLSPMLVSGLKTEGMKARVASLMKEIVDNIISTKESLAQNEVIEKITGVARILRRLPYTENEQLYHKHAFASQTEEDQVSRNIFIDALLMSGNNPSIKLVFDLIQKKEIRGEQASQLLMSLPLSIRTPTQELAKRFYQLVDSDSLEYDQQVKTTAILAFAKFLHQAYVNTRIRNTRYPVQIYGQFGDAKFVQRTFVPHFIDNLEKHLESGKPEDKHFIVTYLVALGSLGLPDVVPVVQRILDDSIDPYIKTQAIFALKGLLVSRQIQNVPADEIRAVDRDSQDILTDKLIENQILPILVSVAFDRGEFPSVRMASISLLLYTTNADVNIWQQLAYSTWFASSQEVHSFIYTSLRNLANVQGPLNGLLWPMVRKARTVLSLAKPIVPGHAKSLNSFLATFSEQLQQGFAQQFQFYGAKDSIIPQYVYYRNFVTQGSGGVGYSPFEASAHGHTIQKLVDYLISQVQQSKPHLNEGHPDFLAIRQLLGLTKREQEEEIEGSIQFTIRNEMQRLFSFNEKKIQELVKHSKGKLLPQLLNGLPFNYQKTFQYEETSVEFPSGLGFPISFASRLPVHLSLRGTIKLAQESNNDDNQIVAEVHAIYGYKRHTRVAFKVPFTGKQYQAGLQKHMVLEAPLRASIRRAAEGQIVFAITPAQLEKGNPSGEVDLLTYHQRPYTIIITDALWPVSHKEGGKMEVIRSNPSPTQQTPYKSTQTFGEDYFGLSFRLDEESDYSHESERASVWSKLLKALHAPTCFFNHGWMRSKQIRFVERTLTLDISKSQTKTLALVFGGKVHSDAKYQNLWQDSSSQSSQSSEESASSAESDSASRQKQSSEYVQTRRGQQNSDEITPFRRHQQSQPQQSREQYRTRHGREQAGSNRPDDSSNRRDASPTRRDASPTRRDASPTRRDASPTRRDSSSEDQSQSGYVIAVALIGKTMPIRSAQDFKTIQKILDKAPSTVQYLMQYSQSSGRSYLRVASGDAANEAAASLPQTSNSLQALSQAVREPSNVKGQQDGCLEFEGEYELPQSFQQHQLLVLRKKLLSEELNVRIKGEIQFGKTCKSMPHQIKVVGKLFRGQKMTEYAHSKSRQAERCQADEKKGFYVSPVCVEVAEQQAAALNRGQFKVEFTQMPDELRNATYNAEDLFKYGFFPYMSHDRSSQQQGVGPGQVQVSFRLTPDQEFFNVEIIKHNSRLSFEDVKTNRLFQAVFPLTATQYAPQNFADRVFRQSESQPSCSLQGNYINTFDNVTYRFSNDAAEGCLHVLAQDCSQEYPVAVLVKDIAADKNEVTILLGQKTKIQLIPQEKLRVSKSAVQVKINGQRVESLPRAIRDLQSNEVFAYVEQMHDGGVQVFSEHFDVATNGQYIVVYASNALRNRTCGVCGDFNGEKGAEMKSPKNCPLSSGSALVASYAFQSQNEGDRSQCKIDPKLKQQIKKEERQCLTDESYFNNIPKKYSPNELRSSGNCEDQMKEANKKVVYDMVNSFLKAGEFNPEKRHKYAKTVAKKVSEKSEKFLKQGSADQIANDIAKETFAQLGFLPAASYSKYASKGAQPLLKRAVQHIINPICQQSGCCTRVPFEQSERTEVESDISYVLADSAEDSETNIPYVSDGSRSKMSCQKMLEKNVQSSLPKQIFLNLQEETEMSNQRIKSVAESLKSRTPKALQEAIQSNSQFADALIKASDSAFGQQQQQQAHKQHQLIRAYVKVAAEELRKATSGDAKCNFSKHVQA